MFWNKNKKLPITEEDKIWVDEDLNWLRAEFGEEHFMEIRTVTPTKDFYERTFDGTEKDAEFILERTKELMGIGGLNLKLDFFSDSPIEMDDGTILTTPADISGSWKSASGIYQQFENDTTISIERKQLKNPISLIATISHELAHLSYCASFVGRSGMGSHPHAEAITAVCEAVHISGASCDSAPKRLRKTGKQPRQTTECQESPTAEPQLGPPALQPGQGWIVLLRVL